jgi:hypothetical protein
MNVIRSSRTANAIRQETVLDFLLGPLLSQVHVLPFLPLDPFGLRPLRSHFVLPPELDVSGYQVVKQFVAPLVVVVDDEGPNRRFRRPLRESRAAAYELTRGGDASKSRATAASEFGSPRQLKRRPARTRSPTPVALAPRRGASLNRDRRRHDTCDR